MSHFFAYVFRAKFIRRWGLMYSTYPETVQEHSLRVAQIAHALAIIKNRLFGGDVSPDRTAVLALYHDASEVLTGDLPTPVKYSNPEIATAYRALERVARDKLLSMVPEPLAAAYEPCFRPRDSELLHGHLRRELPADARRPPVIRAGAGGCLGRHGRSKRHRCKAARSDD